MISNIETVERIPVARVMTRHLATVSANATMDEAIKLLVDHGISGLPVVDEMGKCVGVVTTADVARRCSLALAATGRPPHEDEYQVVVAGHSGAFSIENVPEDCVGQHMTTAVQTIEVEKSVVLAAEMMHRAGIHRLIVVDDSWRPIGVVTSLDILKILAFHCSEPTCECAKPEQPR